MLPYFFMVGIPAVYALVCSLENWNYSNRNKRILDLFFVIWLMLLFCRSENLGVDLPVYGMHFTNYSKMPWNEIVLRFVLGDFEIGYILLCKVTSLFTHNFRWIIILSAFISVVPIWRMYRDEPKHGFLTMVLFINIAPFVMYFSGLRQAMAMAMAVPCYYYCRDRKAIKYLLMVMIAYCLHQSALILILMYPVYHLKIKRKEYLFVILVGTGIVYIFNMPIFTFLLKFMQSDFTENYIDGIQSTGAYSVLLLLVVLLVYSYLIVDSKKINADTLGLRNILVLCVILQCFAGVHTLAMRMNYYFLIFVPILIARIIEKGNMKYRSLIQLSIVCMTCFFSFYYFYNIYTGSDDLGIYPYASFLAD